MPKYRINPDDPRPAYLQLYHQLRDDITGGFYPCGSRLPSKRTLAEDTGTSVITTEEVQEAVVNGPTTYRVLPGITRTVVTNTATGVSRTAATSDETGAQIARTPSGTSGTAGGTDNNIAAGTDKGAAAGTDTGTAVSAENGTEAAGAADAADGAGSGKSQDVSIDGVQADDLQTPQGNIKLDQADADSHSVRKTVLLIIGSAAAVVCAAAVILRVRRSRTGRRH